MKFDGPTLRHRKAAMTPIELLCGEWRREQESCRSQPESLHDESLWSGDERDRLWKAIKLRQDDHDC
jgi:hypothetical protein